MALLSTSSRLIKVGQDYSAGSGISINDHVISVTGEFGNTYSAGENISIDGNVINSKDWTNDIANASANAYNQVTAQIPDPFDPSYLSAQVDNKLNSTAFTTWQNGQYSTDLQTIEGQITNKLDTSSFSDVSASFLTAVNIPESATWNEVSQAYEQASGTYLTAHQSLDGYATEQWVKGQGYLTDISIPESAAWNETSNVVQTNSAQWAEGGSGDTEVNAYVYNNSASIDGTTSVVQSNSSTWNDITAYQSNSASYLTGVDLTPYVPASSISTKLVTTSVFGKDTFVTAISGFKINAASADWSYTAQTSDWAQSAGMAYRDRNGNLFTAYYQPKLNIEGTNGTITAINSSALAGDTEVNELVHTSSATWNTVTDKLDSTAFSDVSGTFLTAHQSLDGYATETLVEETSGAITSLIPTDYYPDTNPSGFISGIDLSPYATTAEVDTLSSMLSGAIDYVSANAGDEFPVSAYEAVQYVQTNSAGIDDTVNNVQTNSGAWGGSALPISAGPGIKVNLADNTLVFSNDETVLYSGAYTSAFSVSEPITNFNNIRIVCHNNRDNEYAFGSIVNTNYFTFGTINWTDITDNNPLQLFGGAYTSTNGTDFTYAGGNQIYFAKDSSNIGGGGPKTGVYAITVSQVIGYNRK